jgi:hypothetical protein
VRDAGLDAGLVLDRQRPLAALDLEDDGALDHAQERVVLLAQPERRLVSGGGADRLEAQHGAVDDGDGGRRLDRLAHGNHARGPAAAAHRGNP